MRTLGYYDDAMKTRIISEVSMEAGAKKGENIRPRKHSVVGNIVVAGILLLATTICVFVYAKWSHIVYFLNTRLNTEKAISLAHLETPVVNQHADRMLYLDWGEGRVLIPDADPPPERRPNEQDWPAMHYADGGYVIVHGLTPPILRDSGDSVADVDGAGLTQQSRSESSDYGANYALMVDRIQMSAQRFSFWMSKSELYRHQRMQLEKLFVLPISEGDVLIFDTGTVKGFIFSGTSRETQFITAFSSDEQHVVEVALKGSRFYDKKLLASIVGSIQFNGYGHVGD
jgi:hypothetical protein